MRDRIVTAAFYLPFVALILYALVWMALASPEVSASDDDSRARCAQAGGLYLTAAEGIAPGCYRVEKMP